MLFENHFNPHVNLRVSESRIPLSDNGFDTVVSSTDWANNTGASPYTETNILPKFNLTLADCVDSS
jgi:hypothetical protein